LGGGLLANHSAIAEQEAHGALDDEEHVVLLVRMRAGPPGVRLEPPFGDRVGAARLGAVGLEQGADAAHRVVAARAGREQDGAPFTGLHWVVMTLMRGFMGRSS
jgi:hypothetical protein